MTTYCNGGRNDDELLVLHSYCFFVDAEGGKKRCSGVTERCGGGGQMEGAGSVAVFIAIALYASWNSRSSLSSLLINYDLLECPLVPTIRFESERF